MRPGNSICFNRTCVQIIFLVDRVILKVCQYENSEVSHCARIWNYWSCFWPDNSHQDVLLIGSRGTPVLTMIRMEHKSSWSVSWLVAHFTNISFFVREIFFYIKQTAPNEEWIKHSHTRRQRAKLLSTVLTLQHYYELFSFITVNVISPSRIMKMPWRISFIQAVVRQNKTKVTVLCNSSLRHSYLM